jgi:hypothetical protein
VGLYEDLSVLIRSTIDSIVLPVFPLVRRDGCADPQALLQAEEMAYSQRPGRASRLLDDRFDLDAGKKGSAGAGGTGVGIKTKQDTGPVVLNLSKDLTREIFEEFPVVQDAYARHVPGVRRRAACKAVMASS